MTGTGLFRLRLAKESLRPKDIPLKALIELLRSLHVGLQYADEDEAKDEEDGLIYALEAIEAENSVALVVACNNEARGLGAYRRLAQIIRLPIDPQADRKVRRPMQAMSDRLGTVIQFLARDSDKPDAEIRPGEGVPRKCLTGETAVYGTLIRVGGKEPRARLELDNGQTISVDLSMEMARQLAPSLYRDVGLVGVAQWDVETGEIVAFSAETILDFRPQPIMDVFRRLAEVAGHDAWQGVDDVVKAVAAMRDGGDGV